MSLIDPSANSEAMLGYHDPTLRVGIDARGDFGGADRAEGEDFFSTLLDIINPLQHIPLVSNLYREITGDEISPAARLMGGGLFGGPIGFASASANVILEQASGDDLLGHALAMFSDDGGPGLSPQQADVKHIEANIHQQADAGGYADAEMNTDFVLGGPPALASLKAAPVAPATQTSPFPLAIQVALNAPVSLAPPVTAQATALVTAPATPASPVVVTETLAPAALIDQTTNNAPQTIATAETPITPETRAAARALPANWVNEALRDAATMNDAVQNGAAPAFGETRPWVGNAILDALSKYEALTKARTSQPAVGPS
jgi:hypothetical protein